MIAMWVYGAVAFALAALAFIAGQIVPGLGMIVAAGGSTAWVAWSVARQRRLRTRC